MITDDTGTPIAGMCNDNGGSSTINCRGTGGDTMNLGARINNVQVRRGLHFQLIDEASGGAGMSYTLQYTIR